jgi:hypothetical protein
VKRVIHSQISIEIKPPVDGAGHMTSDDPSLIFEAMINEQPAGYALVVFPKNKQYSYVGQITVRPEFRMKGVATALYKNIEEYLKNNNKPSLKPSSDLSAGSKRIWDKRLSTGRFGSGWYSKIKTSEYPEMNSFDYVSVGHAEPYQMHENGWSTNNYMWVIDVDGNFAIAQEKEFSETHSKVKDPYFREVYFNAAIKGRVEADKNIASMTFIGCSCSEADTSYFLRSKCMQLRILAEKYLKEQFGQINIIFFK